MQTLDEVAPGIFVWQTYDSRVKADLFSTALETSAGTYLVDPIPLDEKTLLNFSAKRTMAGICVTNVNHARAATEFARTFSVPIYVQDELCGNADFPGAIGMSVGEGIVQGLTGIAIPGGPEGEMALYHHADEGTMVLGDGLINFEPHGFGFLPAKYCLNARMMRRSLGKLLDYSFDRMFFAHGTPILSNARARVEQLLSAAR
jgi:hypothetical protein